MTNNTTNPARRIARIVRAAWEADKADAHATSVQTAVRRQARRQARQAR